MSFTEKHRLEALPDEIQRIEAEIFKLETFLVQPNMYIDHPAKFQKATDLLLERQAALADSEAEWIELEVKAGG
jgi:ATP-binding cassette subfamily F protein uup